MKILFLTTVLPRKKRMGSEVASQSVIDALTHLGNHVTVVGYVRIDDQYELGSQEICAGRRYIETKGAKLYPAIWFAWGLFRGLPYSIAKYWSRAFVLSVRKLLQQGHYDLVILDHAQVSWLAQSVPLTGKLIGMTHNVEHQMYQSFIGEHANRLRRWIYGRESCLLGQVETHFANTVDQLWALTRSDAEFFRGLKKKGEVKEISLPACVTFSEAVTTIKEFDIGLIGSWTWRANEQGLIWFFDNVYPRLPGNIDIWVAGSGAKWLDGRYPNVKYLGFVDDVQAFLRRARAVAIPTLSGGGIQIKTLDAIASGSQVVAAPLAVRGIDDYPPTVAIADTPEQFAALLRSAIACSSANAAHAIEWSRLRQIRFRNEIAQCVREIVASH